MNWAPLRGLLQSCKRCNFLQVSGRPWSFAVAIPSWPSLLPSPRGDPFIASTCFVFEVQPIMCNVSAVNSAFVSSFFISSFGANSFEGFTFNLDLGRTIYTKCRISTHRFSAFFFAEFPIPPLDGFCFWRPWMQHGSCFNRHLCWVHHSCACGRLLPTRCLATFASSHILGFWKACAFGSQPLTIYHVILSYTPPAKTPNLL